MTTKNIAGQVVAIVVTHNRLEKLQKTVARLLQADPLYLGTILICDNASDDGTAEWLTQQSDKRLAVLSLPENSGGAGGFDAGLRHAKTIWDADWYLLMDDDARPASDTFEKFHAQPRNDKDGWACAVYYPDGALCEMNRPWRNPFWHWRDFLRTLFHGRNGFHLSTTAYQSATPQPIDGASFVGLFLSRNAVELAGLPDGRLFLYGDDVLYTLQLSAKGGVLAFDPTLCFEHDCSTFMLHNQILNPLWKVYFYHRNLMLVYRKAAGPILFWPIFLLKFLSWKRRAVHYGRAKKTYERLLAKAMRDALSRQFGQKPQDIEKLIVALKHGDDNAA